MDLKRVFVPSKKQRVSLQLRLTIMAVAISIPLIAGITIFLSKQAQRELTDSAITTLQTANTSVYESLSMWLDYNTRALSTFVSNPDTIAMNSLWQKPLVEEMAANYPHMYLVSTTDVNGVNKVRSDGQPVASYKDRFWFQNALSGASITYEIQIGQVLNQPTLVVSMPIMNSDKQVVGVGMFAAKLDQVSDIVKNIHLGNGGSVFVVDQRNVMVTDSEPDAPVLANFSTHPAVKALRQGQSGVITYVDTKGVRTHAVVTQLGNDWGIIVQQTEAGLFAPIYQFQRSAFVLLVIGGMLILLLTWWSIRQAMRPVHELTETATAIGQGDLSRLAKVSSNDELGLLARTFNQMTEQLRDLIKSLEVRVAERTQTLEHRAMQFQVTSEVAREAAAIRDPEILLKDVVRLIPSRFGYYHAGIFLIEQEGATDSSDPIGNFEGYAVLRAASSEGGKWMLKRGHRLKVGRQGIVGYVASTGKPRIALDVGQDAVFFNNPDLPLTRSEMALPLKARDRVIGVLDVQSTQPAAFQDDDISILQILADQIALAIDNAHLLTESQKTLQELEKAYGRYVQTGWNKRLANKALAYRYSRSRGKIDLATPDVDQSGIEENRPGEVIAPIELRGQQIGRLRLRKPEKEDDWTALEKDLVQETVTQLALSLENARLLEEIRAHANREALINQVVTRVQSSLNPEMVMRTTVREIASLAPLSKIRIQLGAKQNGGNGHRSRQLEPLDSHPAQEES